MSTEFRDLTPQALASDHPFMMLFAEFEAELRTASPNLDMYLGKLKLDMQKDPSLVWKLSPEDIGKVVRGASIISRIEIASSTGAKKKKSDLGALEDALGLGGLGDDAGADSLDFLLDVPVQTSGPKNSTASTTELPEMSMPSPGMTMAQRLAAKRAAQT